MPALPSSAPEAILRICIEPRRDGAYPLRLVPQAGQRPLESRLEAALVEGRLLPEARPLVQGEPCGEGALQSLAQANFEAVFSGALRDAYRDLQARLDYHRRLRLLLEIQPPELHALPWELMYDPWRQT